LDSIGWYCAAVAAVAVNNGRGFVAPRDCRMAPSKDYVVLGSQALVICRPTAIRSHAYHPLAQPPNMAEMLHSYSNTVLHWARQQPGKALQGTAQLAPTASSAGEHASLSHEWLPAMEDWSKVGLSQVEALRRQVEAGSDSSSSSSNSQVPQLQNNIVSMSPLVAASSSLTASHAMGKSRTAVAAAPAAAAAAAAPTYAGSSRSAATQVRWLDNVSGPVCQWPGSGLSDVASNSSAGRNTPLGLRTTDWPVLSGVRAPHKLSGALWPNFSMPGISSRPQGGAANSGLGSSSSSRVGLPVMPVAPATDALAEAFAAAQATLMVPSEYLQVRVHMGLQPANACCEMMNGGSSMHQRQVCITMSAASTHAPTRASFQAQQSM
jgi:hypothetical protein